MDRLQVSCRVFQNRRQRQLLNREIIQCETLTITQDHDGDFIFEWGEQRRTVVEDSSEDEEAGEDSA